MYGKGGFVSDQGIPKRRFKALLEFLLDVAITVRLRSGPGSLVFGAGGGIGFSGVAFSYSQAGLTQVRDRWGLRKEPWVLEGDVV